MRISIIKPGILSTVQDLGRNGYLSNAVPKSGIMDWASGIRSNLALGNEPNAALIEFTYGNSSFLAETDIIIAYSGKSSSLKIGNDFLPDSRALFIKKGKQVDILNPKNGVRTYIAVLGGWDTPLVMGSRSTYLLGGFGGYYGRALIKGDILENVERDSLGRLDYYQEIFSKGKSISNWTVPNWIHWESKPIVRLILGPEFDWFEKESLKTFFSGVYGIGNEMNRMGISLEGEKIKKIENKELISTGLVPGTIQIKGDGSPIILMSDGQTTGGYPRIAQVAWVDMPIIAQLRPLDQIFFKEIDKKEAERLYIEQKELMAQVFRNILMKF